MTSAGVAAGIDLCVHLVRTDYGERVAAEVARRMVVAPHRTGGQAQFLQRPAPPWVPVWPRLARGRWNNSAGRCRWPTSLATPAGRPAPSPDASSPRPEPAPNA